MHFILFNFFNFTIWASFYGHIGKVQEGGLKYLVLFQPSEFMKIFIILSLAKFFDEKKIKDPSDYFFSFTNTYCAFTCWTNFKDNLI